MPCPTNWRMTPELRPRGDRLDGGRDVLDVVARDRRRDAGHHRLAGQVDELGHLGRRVADIERPRTVAVPAVDDGARVDRHDLAGPDRPLAGDAVDDLVVDRDADAGREWPARVDPRVALERRRRAGRADVRLGDGVEMGRRDARPELGLDPVEDLGDDPAGAAHPLDLGTGLAGDHRQSVPAPLNASISSSVTSSIARRPSTVVSTPCER